VRGLLDVDDDAPPQPAGRRDPDADDVDALAAAELADQGANLGAADIDADDDLVFRHGRSPDGWGRQGRELTATWPAGIGWRSHRPGRGGPRGTLQPVAPGPTSHPGGEFGRMPEFAVIKPHHAGRRPPGRIRRSAIMRQSRAQGRVTGSPTGTRMTPGS